MTVAPTSFGQEQTLTGHGFADRIAALLIGESYAMRRLRESIVQVAVAQIPILIVGPTGAGKELVARAVHSASKRPGELVALNVCAVSDSIFEAALFGHVKGAFTGAVTDAVGYLAEANGGTLFLDEISGLSLGAQAKLLRAIETGVYRPVGAARDRLSRFRVVAATNEELSQKVVNGTFREDLYHRLGGFVLRVPSLHQRVTDIGMLVHHFLTVHCNSKLRVSDAALALLEQYAWPGNVRELRHVVERMAILSGDAAIISQTVARAAIGAGTEFCTMKEHQADREVARKSLLEVLESAAWNVDRAAELLRIDRATVYRRMKREGIVPAIERQTRQVLPQTILGPTSLA